MLVTLSSQDDQGASPLQDAWKLLEEFQGVEQNNDYQDDAIEVNDLAGTATAEDQIDRRLYIATRVDQKTLATKLLLTKLKTKSRDQAGRQTENLQIPFPRKWIQMQMMMMKNRYIHTNLFR